MKGDTPVTVDCDADCQRHQLLGFGVEGVDVVAVASAPKAFIKSGAPA
jgi:hypothetical protein